MQLECVVQGGELVTPQGRRRLDVGIAGETIAALEPGLATRHPEATVIDASGHLVLPGVIDVHVHLDLPVAGTVTCDDYRSGTRAAAHGGVTTVIDFATPYGEESMSESIDNWFRRAEGKAMVDYAFHATIANWDRHSPEIPELIERGYPTFKEYMIYTGFALDGETIRKTLAAMKDLGGMLLVHAEAPEILDPLTEQHHTPDQMARYGARLHAMCRPPEVEIAAVETLLCSSEATGGRLYLVHLSTAGAAERVRAARARGVPVVAETCAHYLVFDESVFSRPDGHLFATCPQVKSPSDREGLWQGLQDGDLAVVSTDTCVFTRAQKDAWGGDWTKIPMGLPGLETLLPIVYTFGVRKGRLTVEQMVELLSGGPARIMGLAPRKGAIRVGADADLVVLHPGKKTVIDPAAMESRAGWSPYAGMEMAGFPRTVLSRGEVIVEDHRVVGKEGRGKWISRRL